MTFQPTIFAVTDWPDDEDNPIFPVGSQPKSLLVCPADLINPPLIPNHKYIFKTPRGWQAQQIWSERIAYLLSELVGVSVPRCFIADAEGLPGILVEFFYGFANVRYVERFVHGSDLLMRSILNKKAGRPHGVRTNLAVTKRFGAPSAEDLWGKFLVFDALIGNTDRHPDNWGLIWRYIPGSLPTVRMAPAFDNGTSLGHEIPQAELLRSWSDDRINHYVSRGRHHCGWSPADDRRGKHFELCGRYVEANPVASEAMRSVIRFDLREVRRLLEACVDLGGRNPLTGERAQFVFDLVRVRQAQLAGVLGA